MQTSAKTINKIKLRLAEVPEDRLSEIYDFVEFILRKSKAKNEARNIIKLEGVWKNLGFEKIVDLESEIREIRRESGQSISARIGKWNI